MERSSYHEGGRKPCEQGAKRPKASENSVVLRSRRVPASSNPAKNNPQLWTACSVSGRNAQIGDIPRRFSEVTESDSVLEFLVGANRLNVGSTWRKRRISALFSIYFVGSGASFTVIQFLSARLMFSLSFLRHSFVQYFV